MPTLATTTPSSEIPVQHSKAALGTQTISNKLKEARKRLDLTSVGSIVSESYEGFLTDPLAQGQHSPLFDDIAAYEDFPEHISGRTVWVKEDYQNSPEKWQYRFTDEDVSWSLDKPRPPLWADRVSFHPNDVSQRADVSRAADAFYASGYQLKDISKQTFQLGPHLTDLLATLRDDLVNGKGFTLFKNFPTTRDHAVEKVAAMYMGIGSHLGAFISQNGKGHILGEPCRQRTLSVALANLHNEWCCRPRKGHRKRPYPDRQGPDLQHECPAVLPRRQRRHYRAALLAPRQGGGRVGHCLVAPRLQRAPQRAAGRAADPGRAKLVL